jgi:hypothetical protein
MDPESPPGPQRRGAVAPCEGTVAPGQEPKWLVRFRRAAHIDFAPRYRPPSKPRLVLATVISVVAALAFDELCVRIAISTYPALHSFSPFHVADYATLTVIGVVAACAAWPFVAVVSSTPRWLFFRAAIVVVLVLWLPDVGLFLAGEALRGVVALMVMHLGISLLTYNALVHVATLRPDLQVVTEPRSLMLAEKTVRRVWSSMAILVAAELVLGITAIVTVPFERPNALLPAKGTVLYAAHGAVGIALGVGAVVVLLLSSVTGRMARIGAVMGAAGVLVGLAGGVCATFQSSRLLGMALMLIGVVAAGVGYMVPSLEAMGKAEAARAAAAREALARSSSPAQPVVGVSTAASRNGASAEEQRDTHPPRH